MTIEFREKSDRFVYTKLGEKIEAPAILSYLGKKIPVCYVTDGMTDAKVRPVDMNVQNILPSNMAYLSERLFMGDPLTIAQVFSTLRYTMASGEQVEVVFLCPHFVAKKAVEHGRELLTGYADFTGIEHDYEILYALWDKLMFDGLKGLFELRITKGDTTIMIDYQLATSYFMIKTQKRMQAVAGLQLK